MHAQLQLRKTPWTASPLLPGLTFVVGLLIGVGGVWLWTHRAVQHARTELATATYHLNMAKYELDKLHKITDLRKELEAHFTQILEVTRRSEEATNGEHGKNKKNSAVPRIAKHNLSALSANVVQLEEALAKLENREPRTLDFLPNTSHHLQILRLPR